MIRERLEQTARDGIDTIHRRVLYPYLTRGEAGDDREIAHERTIDLMQSVQNHELALSVLEKLFTYEDEILVTSFNGYELRNPLGVAAGFDKRVEVVPFLWALGPGFVKVGSICLLEYSGNPRPRIFFLEEDQGIINRMGFPGEGVDRAEERLAKLQEDGYMPVVSIAASKPSFDQEKQIEHYVEVARRLALYGLWPEVNVSSPNTPGVRGLQEPGVFMELNKELTSIYNKVGKYPSNKFGPDLEQEKLFKNIRTALDNGNRAVVLANTSTDPSLRSNLRSSHRNEVGGLSGPPIRQKTLEISHLVYKEFGEDVEINAAGSISGARDLWESLTYGGARIGDVLTALVLPQTSCPSFFYSTLREFASAMRRMGLESMEDFRHLRGKKIPYPADA